MSVTVMDYMYALYIGHVFSFGEERIGLIYLMILHIHVHE
jgi:hypothetical protein